VQFAFDPTPKKSAKGLRKRALKKVADGYSGPYGYEEDARTPDWTQHYECQACGRMLEGLVCPEDGMDDVIDLLAHFPSLEEERRWERQQMGITGSLTTNRSQLFVAAAKQQVTNAHFAELDGDICGEESGEWFGSSFNGPGKNIESEVCTKAKGHDGWHSGGGSTWAPKSAKRKRAFSAPGDDDSILSAGDLCPFCYRGNLRGDSSDGDLECNHCGEVFTAGVLEMAASRKTALQTSCETCGLDIEGDADYPEGEWRDRGNNTHCPSFAGYDQDGVSQYRGEGIEHTPYDPFLAKRKTASGNWVETDTTYPGEWTFFDESGKSGLVQYVARNEVYEWAIFDAYNDFVTDGIAGDFGSAQKAVEDFISSGRTASRRTARRKIASVTPGYYLVGRASNIIEGPFGSLVQAEARQPEVKAAAIEYKSGIEDPQWDAYKPQPFPYGLNTVNGSRRKTANPFVEREVTVFSDVWRRKDAETFLKALQDNIYLSMDVISEKAGGVVPVDGYLPVYEHDELWQEAVLANGGKGWNEAYRDEMKRALSIRTASRKTADASDHGESTSCYSGYHEKCNDKGCQCYCHPVTSSRKTANSLDWDMEFTDDTNQWRWTEDGYVAVIEQQGGTYEYWVEDTDGYVLDSGDLAYDLSEAKDYAHDSLKAFTGSRKTAANEGVPFRAPTSSRKTAGYRTEDGWFTDDETSNDTYYCDICGFDHVGPCPDDNNEQDYGWEEPYGYEDYEPSPYDGTYSEASRNGGRN